jgi:hypothetical protein
MAYQGLGYEFAAVVPAVLATGLCKSLCTIQLPDGILIGAGQPSGVFEDVAGLVGLIVMSAPLNETRLTSAETKSIDNVQVFSPRHVWLAGYYPQIEGLVGQGAIAVIDGTPMDLMGAEADSQFQTTRISVRTSAV